MKLTRNHTFSKEEAQARLKALTTYWTAKYGVSIVWKEGSADVDGKVAGVSFKGSFYVKDKEISGDFKVGFLAERLGGRQYVEHKLDEYLDPSRTLDRLKAPR